MRTMTMSGCTSDLKCRGYVPFRSFDTKDSLDNGVYRGDSSSSRNSVVIISTVNGIFCDYLCENFLYCQ